MQSKPTLFQFEPIPLVLSLSSLLNSLHLSSKFPSCTGKLQWGHPEAFPGRITPVILFILLCQLFLLGEVLHPSDQPGVALLFPVLGSQRAGCSTLGGVSPEQPRGAKSPPSSCWLCCLQCSFFIESAYVLQPACLSRPPPADEIASGAGVWELSCNSVRKAV